MPSPVSAARVLLVASCLLLSSPVAIARDELDSLSPGSRLSSLVSALLQGDEKVVARIEPKLPEAVAAWAEHEVQAIGKLSQQQPVDAVARAHAALEVVERHGRRLQDAHQPLLSACLDASRKALAGVPVQTTNAETLELLALRLKLGACLPPGDLAHAVVPALRHQLAASWHARAVQAEAEQLFFARAMFKRSADVIVGRVPAAGDTLALRTNLTVAGTSCEPITSGLGRAFLGSSDALVQAELRWTVCDQQARESQRQGSYSYQEEVADGTRPRTEEQCTRSGGENVWNPNTNSYQWRKGAVQCQQVVVGTETVYRTVNRTGTRTERTLEASLSLAGDLTLRGQGQTLTVRVEHRDRFTSVAWDTPSRRDFHRTTQDLASAGATAIAGQIEAAQQRFLDQLVAAKQQAAVDDLQKEDAWAFTLLTQRPLPADGVDYLRRTYGWSPEQASAAVNALLSPTTPWPVVNTDEVWPQPDYGYVRRMQEEVQERKLERVYSNQHFGASRSWNLVGMRTSTTQGALEPRTGLLLRWEGLDIDTHMDWQFETAPAVDIGWASGGHFAFDLSYDAALAARLGRLMLMPVARLGWGGVTGAEEGNPYRDSFAFHGGAELRAFFNVHRHHGLELDLSMTLRGGEQATWVKAAALRYHWQFEAFYDPWILDVGVFMQSTDVAGTTGLMIGLR